METTTNWCMNLEITVAENNASHGVADSPMKNCSREVYYPLESGIWQQFCGHSRANDISVLASVETIPPFRLLFFSCYSAIWCRIGSEWMNWDIKYGILYRCAFHFNRRIDVTQKNRLLSFRTIKGCEKNSIAIDLHLLSTLNVSIQLFLLLLHFFFWTPARAQRRKQRTTVCLRANKRHHLPH